MVSTNSTVTVKQLHELPNNTTVWMHWWRSRTLDL